MKHKPLKTPLTSHDWPADEDHLWSSWMPKTSQEGTKPPTQYRYCLHPKCSSTETRESPKV